MSSSQQGLAFGLSTGWLYALKVFELLAQERFLEATGANAAEFCIGSWANVERVASLQAGVTFGPQIGYRSLHIADFDGSPVGEWARQTDLIQQFVVAHRVTTAVIHPLKLAGSAWYPCAYYRAVAKAMAVVQGYMAIENMDHQKASGFEIDELACMVPCSGAWFVLDVQHAFEHDSSMKYAWDLFQTLEGSLLHYHVSGELGDNNHALVCEASNAKQIIGFLGRVLAQKPRPIILEGEYQTPKQVRAEIEFLRRELE